MSAGKNEDDCRIEENKRIFESYRDELNKRELSNTENYDRAILTLSSSALGLSLAAIKFVVPVTKSIHLWLLYGGWLSLLISIIISIYAFLLSNKAIAIEREKAEKYYLKDEENIFHSKSVYEKLNSIANNVTGLSFGIGLVLILTFIVININNEVHKMSESKKGSGISKAFLDSANIPKMQVKQSGVEIHSANIPKMQQKPGASTKGSGGNEGSSGTKK